MKTSYIYSHCPVCGTNNVHVHGIRLAEHYTLSPTIRCTGSNRIAPEHRREALPTGSPKFAGRLDAEQIGAQGMEDACGING